MINFERDKQNTDSCLEKALMGSGVNRTYQTKKFDEI